MTKMNNKLDAKINIITVKIERIFSEINGKFTIKLNTKMNSPHAYL